MRIRIGLLMIVAALITGCNSMPESVSYEEVSASPMLLVDEYKIGVDDRVEVNVWKNPDLSITVPVRPDGRISVPLVGEVVAGGKTPETVAKCAESHTGRYLSRILNRNVA